MISILYVCVYASSINQVAKELLDTEETYVQVSVLVGLAGAGWG